MARETMYFLCMEWRALKVINLYTYQATITLYTYNILLTIKICGFWIDFQKSKSIELVCISQIYLMPPSPPRKKTQTKKYLAWVYCQIDFLSQPSKFKYINQIYLPSSKMTTSSWAYSWISTSQARILSKLVLFVTSYRRSRAKISTKNNSIWDFWY